MELGTFASDLTFHMQTTRPKISANEPQLPIPIATNTTDTMMGNRDRPIVITSAMMDDIPIFTRKKLSKENISTFLFFYYY